LGTANQTMGAQNTMQEPQLITTEDGSHSLWMPGLQEAYHSTHGAIQEAQHVFIRHGLLHWLNNEAKSSIRILEVGLGTGLNALLTYLASLTKQVQVAYTGLEPFPIPHRYVQSFNYATQLAQQASSGVTYKELQVAFEKLHRGTTIAASRIADHFLLDKSNHSLQAFSAPPNTFDMIYFDAFSPNKQPTMWSMNVLQKVYQMTKHRGIIVTYCAQGKLKRSLKQLGMHVETLPGPPGKKEMIRARK